VTRRTGSLAVALVAVLVLAGTAQARTRPACHPRGGKVVMRSRALIVYTRVIPDDPYGIRTVYACVIRTGRTRKLGTIEHLATSTSDTTILAHAGVHLVVDNTSGDQYGSSESTTWWNVATGKRRTMGVVLDRALLTSDGCTVLAHATDRQANTATVLTAAFSGPLTELDRGTADAIPRESLVLSGRRAGWTNASQPRSTQLAPATC
jgi:hypothetical protein